MKFSFVKQTAVILLTTTISFIAVVSFFAACSETTPPPVIPPDDPPEITLFTIDKSIMTEHDTATVSFGATDDKGIDSAIIDFQDSSGFIYRRYNSGTRLSGGVTRQWGFVGFHTTMFTVYDTKGQVAQASIYVQVYPDTMQSPRTSFHRK
jgi:hypothetical protein